MTVSRVQEIKSAATAVAAQLTSRSISEAAWIEKPDLDRLNRDLSLALHGDHLGGDRYADGGYLMNILRQCDTSDAARVREYLQRSILPPVTAIENAVMDLDCQFDHMERQLVALRLVEIWEQPNPAN